MKAFELWNNLSNTKLRVKTIVSNERNYGKIWEMEEFTKWTLWKWKNLRNRRFKKTKVNIYEN